MIGIIFSMRKIPPLILFILCVGFFGWKFLHATIDSVDVLTIDSSTTNGPTFTTATDRYGSSVANIGDLNDDGVEDIAVGAPYDSTGGTERGSVHIHFMNLDGSIDSTVKLTGATTNGATLIDADRYGTSVVGLGI